MENSFFREIVQILRVNGPFGCLFVVCFLFSPLISEAKPISASSVSVEAESSVLSTEAQKGKGLVFVRRPTLKNDKGEQLTSKDNSRLAEVIEESRLLKEHREVLIQYTKELRDKYQKLQKFCLQSSDGVCNKEDSDSQKEKKQIEAKVTFEPQNFYKEELALLKSEIDKITSAKKELQKNLEDKSKEYSDIQKKYELLESELSAVKAELESARNQSRDIGEKSSGEVGKLKSDLEQKENEARECLVHLEKSQELVSKIPDFERDILALKNELLIRKSAEELLDPGSSSGRAVSVNEKVNTASPVKPGSSSRADDASGRQQVGSSDVTILEVTGNKVSLRAGPGLNHSSLMDIQSGAKLLVEAREGEWYRVTAPTGGRAYIHSNYGRVVQRGSGDVSAIPPVPRKPPLPFMNNVRGRDDQVKAGRPMPSDDMIPVDIPSKPVRRAGAKDPNAQVAEKAGAQGKGVEIDVNSPEALAIEQLMKAMDSQVKGTKEAE